MSNHISVPTTTKLGADVNQLVSQMQTAHDAGERLVAIMAEISAGDDLTALAAALGIASEADAATVKAMITAAYAYALNLPDFTYVLSRLG